MTLAIPLLRHRNRLTMIRDGGDVAPVQKRHVAQIDDGLKNLLDRCFGGDNRYRQTRSN